MSDSESSNDSRDASEFRPRRETSIHGADPGYGFLARLHRLRDWTHGDIGLTNREIEELLRVVPEGTPVEVRP